MSVVLIGGNPKGYDRPFDPNTLSGKRLRKILRKLKFDVEIADMTKNIDDVPTREELTELYIKYKDYDKIVFLGRFVEKELRRYFPNGLYLPHPASRRDSDLKRLEAGLAEIATNKDQEV